MIDVLVPHDLTTRSDAALEAVLELHVPVGHLHVLHVLPRLDLANPGVVWPRDEDEPRRLHARKVLKQRLATTAFADAVLHVRIGDAAARVVEAARELDIGLVAIASHGRSGLARMVLGSVAEHVARFSPCPVLIVPPGAARLIEHQAPPPRPDPNSRDEHVDELGCEVSRQVEDHEGTLSAITVAIPRGEDPEEWTTALEQRLAASGIDWVDVTVRHTDGSVSLLDARFEERWG